MDTQENAQFGPSPRWSGIFGGGILLLIAVACGDVGAAEFVVTAFAAGGVALIVTTVLEWYDRLPLPTDPIEPPALPDTSPLAPWRSPTGIRHLERLKADFMRIEAA